MNERSMGVPPAGGWARTMKRCALSECEAERSEVAA